VAPKGTASANKAKRQIQRWEVKDQRFLDFKPEAEGPCKSQSDPAMRKPKTYQEAMTNFKM
jgi:hypothetical protein